MPLSAGLISVPCRSYGGCRSRRQRGRKRYRRRGSFLLGGGVQNRPGVRRPRLAFSNACGRARAPHQGGPLASTTIALVATDATLTKAQAKRLAVMAQDGLARAIYPVHTPLDGDTVFAASTGRRPLTDPIYEFTELGALAANVLARAVARGVYEATALPFRGALPSWRDRFSR
jgi:L-aminopeptidase/D-esterase-like protein